MSSTQSIFEYTDYRKFLGDFYRNRKKDRPEFSFRLFSRLAGFRSPNFLQLVIIGKRNLTDSSAEKIARAIHLGERETRFFRTLVRFNQSTTSDEKNALARELLRSRPFRRLHPLTELQFEYHRQWYFPAIRELIGKADFREDFDWISKQLCPSITPSQARDALGTLLRIGLVERDSSRKLKLVSEFITTGDEVARAPIAEFHRRMIQLGSESIERFPSSSRDISGLTLGVSAETAAAIKQRVQEFRKELLAMVAADPKTEQILQVNFQVFPLSEITGVSDETK